MSNNTTILVVDDNFSQLVTMSLILKRKGYLVENARDGIEAVEQVQKNSVDIVFMDIKMPRMNGIDAYKEIKKIKPELPVILLTAYTAEDLLIEGIQAGVYKILYKPVDMEEVLSLIEELP